MGGVERVGWVGGWVGCVGWMEWNGGGWEGGVRGRVGEWVGRGSVEGLEGERG